MTNAIELVDVSKIYRRYGGRQFATLKSALLQRSIMRDLQPGELVYLSVVRDGKRLQVTLPVTADTLQATK